MLRYGKTAEIVAAPTTPITSYQLGASVISVGAPTYIAATAETSMVPLINSILFFTVPYLYEAAITAAVPNAPAAARHNHTIQASAPPGERIERYIPRASYYAASYPAIDSARARPVTPKISELIVADNGDKSISALTAAAYTILIIIPHRVSLSIPIKLATYNPRAITSAAIAFHIANTLMSASYSLFVFSSSKKPFAADAAALKYTAASFSMAATEPTAVYIYRVL